MSNSSSVVSVSSTATPMPLSVEEQVIFRTRPQAIIPFSLVFLIWAVGAIFLWFLNRFGVLNSISLIKPIIFELAYLGAFVFVGLVLFLHWLKTSYILTNKRVEWRFGIIGQGVISIRLDHIENIKLKLSIFGRLFNFGNIKIEPAGLTTAVTFNGIGQARERKDQIEEACN